MDHVIVISELCYKGQFYKGIIGLYSSNSFVKFHGKTIWEPQNDPLIQICVIARCVMKGLHCNCNIRPNKKKVCFR